MAVKHVAHKTGEAWVVSLSEDFCKTPVAPAGYMISQKLDCSIIPATSVRGRGTPLLTMKSRISSVIGNEAGVGGGVRSGVNVGMCRPIEQYSPTVRAEGSFVLRHDTLFEMNCAAPNAPGNTRGRLVYTTTPAKSGQRLVILIGGARDSGQSKGYAPVRDGLKSEVPEGEYFTWMDESAIVDRIRSFNASSPGGSVEIIGHSYGGDTALDIAETLNTGPNPIAIDKVTTLDPVSTFDPDQILGDPRTSNVKRWENVYVEGLSDISDGVAILGGRWGREEGADLNIKIPAGETPPGASGPVSHADAAGMYRVLGEAKKAGLTTGDFQSF